MGIPIIGMRLFWTFVLTGTAKNAGGEHEKYLQMICNSIHGGR